MITEFRQTIMELLTGSAWPVYMYEPDDVASVPLIVVARPTVDQDLQLYTATVPVIVVGRRDGTEDAQSELDAATSQTAYQLSSPDANVAHIEPTITSIAELTYPSYRITVQMGTVQCQPVEVIHHAAS